MKDKRTQYGTMDKSQLNQQVCGNMLISCIVRKNWPYPPSTTGSYSRQAGQQMKYWWILKFLKFSTDQIVQIFLLFNITAMLL